MQFSVSGCVIDSKTISENGNTPGEIVSNDFSISLTGQIGDANCQLNTVGGDLNFILTNPEASGDQVNVPYNLGDGFNGSNIDGNSTYSMDIYDFTGQKVISKDVSNVIQENETVQQLKPGIYIIKTSKATRKVFVGNR